VTVATASAVVSDPHEKVSRENASQQYRRVLARQEPFGRLRAGTSTPQCLHFVKKLLRSQGFLWAEQGYFGAKPHFLGEAICSAEALRRPKTRVVGGSGHAILTPPAPC
jgi:hypothetical protein